MDRRSLEIGRLREQIIVGSGSTRRVVCDPRRLNDCKLIRDYENLQKIGSGGFGLVMQAKKKGEKGSYAIKMIPFPQGSRKTETLDEAERLSGISKHDSVISCLDYWEDAFTRSEHASFISSLQLNKDDHFSHVPENGCKFLCIRMELCGNGNLKTWLKRRKEFNFMESMQIFLQIARGIEHVHASKLIHRDLKPANILFNGKMAKISDFGWSVAHQSGDSSHTARAGAALYQAPEQAIGKYGPSVDYYALGLILYELFHLDAQKNVGEALNALRYGRTSVREGLRNYPEVAGLIQALTAYKPTERPNCEQIVKILKARNVFDTTMAKGRNGQQRTAFNENVLLENCRHCRQHVVGVRYKCSICKDCIICEDCEDIHPESHDLLKIKKVAAPERDQDKNGCQHYRRKCQVQCPDPNCKQFFVCRLCHDETVEGHSMDRFKVEVIQCMSCGLKQSPRDVCLMCKTKFAAYSCVTCNLFDDAEDAEKMIFHCVGCGICRRKKNETTEYVHCDNCSMCYPSAISGVDVVSHECIKNAGTKTCSVCFTDMFNSRDEAVLVDCHHYVHLKCRVRFPNGATECPDCGQW